MQVLVIGGGGREHALVWKLAQSPHITRLACAPGNAGIAGERLVSDGSAVECVGIGADHLEDLLRWAREHKIDLTVVGPDNPLALGIVDRFQAARLRIWGPSRQAAQFEASKAFSQEFMSRHNIPTARAAIFSEPAEARRFADSLDGRCVVKADGLALGKGVLICTGREEAVGAIDQVMVKRAFGEAGSRVVIQELLEGRELSMHAICDGRTAKLFPSSQDHKRALDGNQGLNTGGMGTCSPATFVNEVELEGMARSVLEPWLQGCAEEGIDFRGILYPGLMMTTSGPRVLEFNARFGDPEAQVYLTRLQSDLLEVLDASLRGTLDQIELEWRPESSVCVVMASPGYPGAYPRGAIVTGLEEAGRLPDTRVFHAGTLRHGSDVVTNGGRVLGVTSWGNGLEAARKKAYEAVRTIHFEGAQFRRDIASDAVI